MPWSEQVPAGWVLAHLAIAAAGTWAARRYALRRRLIDQPGARRSHAAATPRGGGIAIVLALLAATCWLAWKGTPVGAGDAASPRPLLASFGLGLVLVSGVGWIDDHRPLSPWLRLGVHVLAAGQLSAIAWLATGELFPAAVAMLGPLVLANVWNFMDGIDGIAASQALLVALVLAAWLTGAGAWLAVALAAACAGFLPFNFPRSRIFLGDVGSGALGFALGALLAWLAVEGRGDGALVFLALLPLSAFLLDAGLTLSRRILQGEPWWLPHVTHAYQHLVRRCGAHWPVTLGYSVFTLAASGLAVWAAGDVRSGLSTSVIIAALAWHAVGAALWIQVQRGGTSRKKGIME